MHCFVALANNGSFSDCRIRAPMAVRWLRDIARLINRNANDVLRVDLETVGATLGSLRHFHQKQKEQVDFGSHAHEEGDAKDKKKIFKPVPPDFPA